ncbi:MAG: amidohydrolase family protein [Planctomycetota bacterium]
MKRFGTSMLAAVAALPAAGQDLATKAPPQQGPIAIINATVHTVADGTIENGFVAFEGGVITAVGSDEPELAADVRVIDVDGLDVWPGMISPVTELGLTEMQAIRQTRDFDEVGRFTPEARAATATNPDSTLIPVTRANGILTYAAFPSNGAVPGTASIMRAEGWTWEDMAIETDAGVILNWPSMRPSQDWWADEPNAEQRQRITKRLDEIDSYFRTAINYAHTEPDGADVRLDAMRPSLPGRSGESPERPVFINAEDVDQINAAVVWATGLGLRPVIVGGRDAALCTALLLEHDVPVMVGGTQRFPKRADSPHDAAYTLPLDLENAGIRWCMASSDRTGHERNLPYNASKAVAFGLDKAAAVRSLTLSSAEILEVDDRIGSLEVGKAATLIVTDGHLLEHTTNPLLAFIDGREIDLGSKQSVLAEKYREKYRQTGLSRDE